MFACARTGDRFLLRLGEDDRRELAGTGAGVVATRVALSAFW